MSSIWRTTKNLELSDGNVDPCSAQSIAAWPADDEHVVRL